MSDNNAKWKDLSFKDKGAYTTAFVSFTLGFILLFLGFFVSPIGEIDASVITSFGTALVYTGSIMGISMYIKGATSEMRVDLLDKVQHEVSRKFKEKEDREKMIPDGHTPTDSKMEDVYK